MAGLVSRRLLGEGRGPWEKVLLGNGWSGAAGCGRSDAVHRRLSQKQEILMGTAEARGKNSPTAPPGPHTGTAPQNEDTASET